jgi:excisionase family DNA binding protein
MVGAAGLATVHAEMPPPAGDRDGRRARVWGEFVEAVKAAGLFRLAYPVPEVARLLGISRSYAYALVTAGEIPSVRIGGKPVVPAVDVFALVMGAGSRATGDPMPVADATPPASQPPDENSTASGLTRTRAASPAAV